jgi:tellurite resistance protein TerC
MWGVFLSLVLILLALDLGIFHRRQRAISVRESLTMSGMYVVMSLLFSLWIAHELGAQSANEYLTGFLIEKTLSMDNIFVISLIFSFFKIPLKFQHRVLFWGILGVIFLRGLMIGLGAKLISEFEWVLYIFAIFLIYTGIKMFFVVEETKDFEDNHVLKFFRRHLPITKELHGEKFCVIETNPKTGRLKLFWTPLFLTLIFIEMMDLVFAIDSVPAIFAITTDTYIVYTSNIFAILGLRALYFALAAIIYRFIYLKYALAMVLVFIGSKIFIADALGLEKIPATFSLTVTILLLAGGIVYSLYKTRQEEGEREGER